MNANKLIRKSEHWGSMAVGSHGQVTVEINEKTKGSNGWELEVDADPINWRIAIQSPAIITQLIDFLEKGKDSGDEIQIGSLGKSPIWLRRDNEFNDRYFLVADGKDGRLETQFTGTRIADLQRSLEQIVADNDEIANWYAADANNESKRSTKFKFGLGTFLVVFSVTAVLFAIESNRRYEEYRKRQAVAKTLEEFRQMIATYSLTFDSVFPNNPLNVYDEKLLDRFPTPESWPDALGPLPRRPSNKAIVLSTLGELFKGTGIVPKPLTGNLVSESYATLILDQGGTDQSKISFGSYAYCISKGDMNGNMFMGSYGTTYIRGDLNGTVVSDSYFAMMLEGKMTGHIETNSYAMIYLLGGFEGTINLANSRVYIAGTVTKDDLKRIEGQGTIFAESSDIPDGTVFNNGKLTFRVVGRAHK